jgi:hypothetical protein
VLTAGGYSYLGGRRADNGVVFYVSSASDHRHARTAMRHAVGNNAETAGGAAYLRRSPTLRRTLERAFERVWHVPVRITRVRTWHVYLVLDLVSAS